MNQTDNLSTDVLALVEAAIMRSVNGDTRLLDAGLVDSVIAVEIVMAVEMRFGVCIPSTEIAEHLASADALTRFIATNR